MLEFEAEKYEPAKKEVWCVEGCAGTLKKKRGMGKHLVRKVKKMKCWAYQPEALGWHLEGNDWEGDNVKEGLDFKEKGLSNARVYGEKIGNRAGLYKPGERVFLCGNFGV